MESSRYCQLLRTYQIMLLTVTFVNMFFAHGVLSSASTCSSPGPLGMRDGRIRDAQITASDYDTTNLPQYARLYKNDGYWATAEENPDDPWIQVDLLEPVTITGIQTQGSSHPSWEDWVTELQIQYGLQNAEEAYIVDGTQNKIFQANTDRDTVVDIPFPGEIRARYLRIVPTEKKGWISLRFEVNGCRDVATTSVSSTVQITTSYDLIPTTNVPTSTNAVCRDGYSLYGTTCYRVYTTGTTWQDALNTCNAEGTSLLTIHNSEENDFFVGQAAAVGIYLWIGLNDLRNESIFQWADGSPVIYTNWDSTDGQPDDHQSIEDCVHIYNYKAQWNDGYCGFKDPGFICAEVCGDKLGMENGDIPDENIRASQQKSDRQAKEGRLNGPWYWETGRPVDPNPPWIQVDIGYETTVTGLITQGDEEGINGDWVTSFKVSTSLTPGGNLTSVLSRSGTEIFQGNYIDGSIEVVNFFLHSVEAQVVRITCITKHGVYWQFRFELLGCKKVQPEGDLRLANGNSSAGRLEIYHDTEWGSVCDDNFITVDATVACKQLGFTAGKVASPFGVYGEGSGPIWLDEVECVGNESRLAACQSRGWGNTNCGHGEDVGVICYVAEGDLRLANGNSSAGRLEIYHDTEWGSVCDDNFITVDATVACKQLGFTAGKVASPFGVYGEGSGPIWLDEVECVGNENRLSDCQSRGWGNTNCGHGEDVGVICYFAEGDLRLANGNSSAGRLEIYHDTEWGSVCDDNFYAVDATVACKQLGFTAGKVASPFGVYGEGVGSIWLDEVGCFGNESRLADCQSRGWGNTNCGRREDVGVICYEFSTPTPEVTYEASTTENYPTTEGSTSTIPTTHSPPTTKAQTSHAPTTTQAPDKLDQELDKLLNETVTTENVESVAAALTDLVATDTKLSDQNLDNINEVLISIVNVSSPSVNVTRSVVTLVDDIINSYDEDSVSDVTIPEAPNQIQRALESQISTLQTQSGNTTIEEDNIAIQAVKIPIESVSDGRLVFDRIGDDQGRQLDEDSTMVSTGETPRPEAEVAISFQLPQDILDSFPSNGSLPISFIVYQNDKLFPSLDITKTSNDANEFSRKVGGRIISATVETVDVINLSDNPVELHFTLNKVQDDKIGNITCVFWDNKASNGLGDWSTEGCYRYQNQSEPVICHCTHLTSFSVLVDRFEVSSYVPVLDIISKIGCGVSIICLVLALVTYLSNKKIRSKEQQQIFISFCISLVSLYVIFIFGIERTNPQWGCIVVSILLHYFTLTTILWMAVEAFTMYVNVVKVVGVHISKFMLKASLVAWGVPAVVVAVIAIADVEQYRNSYHCFINIDYPFYFTQVLLLLLTILFNGYIFIRVMYRLTYGRIQSSSTRNQKKTTEMKKRVKRALALSSLLGLTWVFGLLSLIHEDATLTFQILFCVFNSLQGLFVFIMFCVLNHDIRAIWKVWCCKGFSDVPLYSSSTGKTGSSTVPNYNKSEMATSQM